MSWFKREPKEPKVYGWRIITRRNEALDKTVYRVWLDGHLSKFDSRPPRWEDFDTYEDALAFYHEKAGWSVEKVEQP